MLVHRLLVERVDLRRLGGSAGGNDVLGDRLDRCQVAPGEEDPGPLAREGACDGAADRASGSVDHRNLVLQHHLCSLLLGLPIGAVDDADTATSGNWAQPATAQFVASAGVYTGWEVRRGDGEQVTTW